MREFKYRDNAFVKVSNYVTHRERGVIPGCIPAVDVFVERTQEEIFEYLAKKTEKFSRAVKAYIAGEYGGIKGEKEMWYDADKGNMPMVIIRNPAKLSKYM